LPERIEKREYEIGILGGSRCKVVSAAPGSEAYSTAIILEMLSGSRFNHRAHRGRLKEIAL
jgi:hypothetical protein